MLSQILCSAARTVLSEEQMQNLEALDDDELKGWFDEGMKSLTEKKTTKKERPKSKKKCAKEEEESKMRRDDTPRQATWEEEFAQGRAYFSRKDYSR